MHAPLLVLLQDITSPLGAAPLLIRRGASRCRRRLIRPNEVVHPELCVRAYQPRRGAPPEPSLRSARATASACAFTAARYGKALPIMWLTRHYISRLSAKADFCTQSNCLWDQAEGHRSR